MHDGPGDDHRHAAYGAVTGRRRRAKCADWAGGDWRPLVRDHGNAVYRAGDVFAVLQRTAGELGPANRRRNTRSVPMSAGDATPSGPSWNDQGDEHQQRRPGRRLLWILIVVAVLVVALLIGWLPHQKRNKEVNAKAKQQQNCFPLSEG